MNIETEITMEQLNSIYKDHKSSLLGSTKEYEMFRYSDVISKYDSNGNIRLDMFPIIVWDIANKNEYDTYYILLYRKKSKLSVEPVGKYGIVKPFPKELLEHIAMKYNLSIL